MPKFLDKKERDWEKGFSLPKFLDKREGVQRGIFLAKIPGQKERRPGEIFCAIFFFKKKTKKYAKTPPKRDSRHLRGIKGT